MPFNSLNNNPYLTDHTDPYSAEKNIKSLNELDVMVDNQHKQARLLYGCVMATGAILTTGCLGLATAYLLSPQIQEFVNRLFTGPKP